MAANNIPPEPIPISQSPVPLSQIDRAPAPVPTDTTATPTIPAAWILQAPQPVVDIANIAEPAISGPSSAYSIAVYANGVLLTSQVHSIDFVGNSVVATVDRNNVTVTITSGNGTPGGNNQQVQFNNNGVFGGVTGFTFNSSSNVLNIPGNLISSGNITGNYLFGDGSQLTNLPAGNYSNANVATFLGAFGSNAINTTGTITGGNFVQSGVGNVNGYNAYFANNITAQGTVQATGLIIPAGSGTFYGNTTTGVGALFAGLPGYTELGSNVVAQFAANVNSYAQINLQNLSTGELASADYIITGDIGNNSSYYADFGLASSTHLDPYFFGDVGTSNDAYLFVAASDPAGPSSPNGPGNLILGSTNGLIKMFVGNTAQANVIATISSTGLDVVGNITTSTVITNEIRSDDSSFVTIYDGLNVDGGIETHGNITADYFIGNGSQLTGIATSTGNIGFTGDAIYDLNGIILENADLTHGATAAVVLPANGNTNPIQVNNTYGNITLQSGSNASITASWTFDNTGNLNLPQGGVVHETGIPFGGLEGNTIALKPSGGTDADQQLLVYPTAGADFNHLHLTTGNLWNTEMFLGNDDFYVKLANTGSIIINTNDNDINTAQWNFSPYGEILTTGDLFIQTPNGVPNNVTAITGSSGSWESNPTTNLATTNGTGAGLTVTVTETGGYASAIAIVNPGSGYANGDVITVTSGSSSATFTISVANNQWILDTQGELTLPTISLGSGLNEQTVISSQRKLIPPFRWSAEITGTTPTVVYTAISIDTTSMKVTVQIQHTGLGFEFFEVFATSTGGDTWYTVSNRVAPPTIDASTVVVDLNGSNIMQITVTINSGAATSWVTYDAAEFGIPND